MTRTSLAWKIVAMGVLVCAVAGQTVSAGGRLPGNPRVVKTTPPHPLTSLQRQNGLKVLHDKVPGGPQILRSKILAKEISAEMKARLEKYLRLSRQNSFVLDVSRYGLDNAPPQAEVDTQIATAVMVDAINNATVFPPQEFWIFAAQLMKLNTTPTHVTESQVHTAMVDLFLAYQRRAPPGDVDASAAVLATLVLSPDQLRHVIWDVYAAGKRKAGITSDNRIEGLDLDEFVNLEHRRQIKAIQEAYQGKPVVKGPVRGSSEGTSGGASHDGRSNSQGASSIGGGTGPSNGSSGSDRRFVVAVPGASARHSTDSRGKSQNANDVISLLLLDSRCPVRLSRKDSKKSYSLQAIRQNMTQIAITGTMRGSQFWSSGSENLAQATQFLKSSHAHVALSFGCEKLGRVRISREMYDAELYEGHSMHAACGANSDEGHSLTKCLDVRVQDGAEKVSLRVIMKKFMSTSELRGGERTMPRSSVSD